MMLAAALVMLLGHVTDRTTSQPLPSVVVDVRGPVRAHAMTNAEGAYTVKRLKPGRYHVTLSSDDVPPQSFDITVGKRTTTHDFVACSTTLDFRCTPGF